MCNGDIDQAGQLIPEANVDCLTYNHIDKLAEIFKSSKDTKSILQKILTEYEQSTTVPKQNPPCTLKTIGKAVNWLTDHQLPTLYKDKEKYAIHPIREMFILAVLDHRTDLTDLLWKYLDRDFIAASIMASFLMKFISIKLKNQQAMFNLSRQLSNRADEYETKAANILEESYQENPEMAHLLLVRSLDEWDHRTVFSLAFAGGFKIFLQHDCCQQKLNEAWFGTLPCYTPKWKVAIGIICPLVVTYSNARGACCENRSSCIKESFEKLIWNFYSSPIVKFSTYTLSYVTFLCVFSFFILTQMRPGKINIYEYLVWIWASSVYADELRQLTLSTIKAKSLNPRKIEYFDSWWNIYDQVLFLFVVLAMIFRNHLPAEYFFLTANVYALAFVLYMLRILQNFYVIQAIGPKIEIIYRMLKDLCFFLLLFLLFILAFGIAFQSLVHPPPTNFQAHLSHNFTSRVLTHILYIPYFVIFQQFDDIKDQISNCEDSDYTDIDSANYIPKCSKLAAAFYLVYILITSLLLVNLLIATFSSSYNEVEEIAEQTWLFHRFEIISEYIEKPTLIPPLILLNHIWRLIKYFREKAILHRKRAKPQTTRGETVTSLNIAHTNILETTFGNGMDFKAELPRLKRECAALEAAAAESKWNEFYDRHRMNIYCKHSVGGDLSTINKREKALLKAMEGQ